MKERSRLNVYLIKGIIVFSTCITFLVTSFQLFFEYKTSMKTFNEVFDTIEANFLTNITSSVWNFNQNQTDIILDSARGLKGVIYAEIRDEIGTIIHTSGTIETGKNIVQKKFALSYENGNVKKNIGSLIVYGNKSSVIDKLINMFFVILLSNGVKTIIVASFLFWFFSKNVTNHINTISNHFREMKSSENYTPIVLNRKGRVSNEIDFLVLTVNSINEKLSEHHKDLEKIVQKRTEELRDQLETVSNLKKKLVAQEKLAYLGKIMAGIAHEINNPTNNIFNSSRVLYRKIKSLEAKDGEKLGKQCEIITRNSQRIAGIVRKMMNHARSSNMKIENINISDVIEKSMEISLKDTMEAGELKISVDKDLTTKSDVLVYEEDMLTIFTSIFENAAYALKEKDFEDTSSPKVKVSSQNIENQVEIIIEDNGPGISKDVVKKIFDPFFTTKPCGVGTGLGLAMVNELIHSYDGIIEVDTEDGKYSKFKISLPLSNNLNMAETENQKFI